MHVLSITFRKDLKIKYDGFIISSYKVQNKADVVITLQNKSGENFRASNLADFIFPRDYWSGKEY